MTSISSTLASFLQPPGSKVQSRLQSAVSSSSISAADQTALSGAITDIFSQLTGASTATTAATTTITAASGTTAAPASMKDRVDGAIDNEVSSGKLTSDQATELKSLFAKAAGHMHMHHAHAAAPATDLASTDDDTTDALGVTTDGTDATTSPTSPTGITAVVDDASKALDDFVSRLKSATASNGLYGAAGSSTGGIGSLLVSAFA
jgi:hypothetical protein